MVAGVSDEHLTTRMRTPGIVNDEILNWPLHPVFGLLLFGISAHFWGSHLYTGDKKGMISFLLHFLQAVFFFSLVHFLFIANVMSLVLCP